MYARRSILSYHDSMFSDLGLADDGQCLVVLDGVTRVTIEPVTTDLGRRTAAVVARGNDERARAAHGGAKGEGSPLRVATDNRHGQQQVVALCLPEQLVC